MIRLERLALLLLATVTATSLAASGLLICGFFSAQLALVIGFGVAIPLVRPLWRHVDSGSPWKPRRAIVMYAVLLAAFLLRWPPALHLQGGQDQGVYMAMAAHFVETGDLYITDHVRDRLDTPESISRYDKNNLTGVYEPGIYTDSLLGRYFPRFYHLHPLWIGMFGGIAGMQHAANSQLFFALISLLFVGMLLARVSGDWRIGVACTSLFTILPIHVFFSKFPISEMPAMAFALMGFFAIVRYHQSTKAEPLPAWLALAALSFLSLFLTRISGFLYIPFFLLGGVLSHAFVDAPRVRLHWHLFWLGCIACYGLSVTYGLIWSAPYSREIYSTGMGKRLYAAAPMWLPCLVASIPAAFYLTRSVGSRERLRALLLRMYALLERSAPFILVALASYGLLKTGLLAFTDHYRNHPWYDVRWNSSHGGLLAIARSSLFVAAEHLTPVATLLMPFALWYPGRSAARVLLVAMSLTVAAYTVIVQWFTPYQYYYARYLLSELVPFMLMLLILRCGDWWRTPRYRPRLVLAGLFTAAYCAWFTLPLVGMKEADGAEASINRIASHLDNTDVLLIDAANVPLHVRLSTPLRLWFGTNTYILKNRDQVEAVVLDLKRARFSDIYMLGGTGSIMPGFQLLEHANYNQRVMAYRPYIPREAQYESTELAFYRLDEVIWAGNALKSASGLPIAALAIDCCSGFYADRMWTSEKATIHGVPFPAGQWNTLLLKVAGNRPDYADAQVEVRINGRELRRSGMRGKEILFDLGSLNGGMILDLEISSSTFVPSEVRIGADDRRLGVDIEALRLQ